MTAEALERETRAYFDAQGFNTISTDTLQVGGLPAARNYFTFSTEDSLRYGMQIYVVDGSTAYEISVESYNEGIFREHRHNIDSFVEGIRFL